MTEAIRNFFENTFTNPYVATFLIAMLPIIELRGAIPFGYYYFLKKGFEGVSALFAAAGMGLIGSTFVVPFILLLLLPLLGWLKKTKLFKGLATKLENRFTKKSERLKEKAVAKATAKLGDTSLMTGEERARVEKRIDRRIFLGKFFGVMTFVAIPLPFTGVWTGSAVAAFLHMKFRWAVLAVVIGNLIAGTVITLVSWGLGFAFI